MRERPRRGPRIVTSLNGGGPLSGRSARRTRTRSSGGPAPKRPLLEDADQFCVRPSAALRRLRLALGQTFLVL